MLYYTDSKSVHTYCTYITIISRYVFTVFNSSPTPPPVKEKATKKKVKKKTTTATSEEAPVKKKKRSLDLF